MLRHRHFGLFAARSGARLQGLQGLANWSKMMFPSIGGSELTSNGLQSLGYSFQFHNLRIIKWIAVIDSVVKVYTPKNSWKFRISLADTSDFVRESSSNLSLSHTW